MKLTLNRRTLVKYGALLPFAGTALAGKQNGSLWNITVDESVYVQTIHDDMWIHYTRRTEKDSWRSNNGYEKLTCSWKATWFPKNNRQDIHDEISNEFWNHQRCIRLKKNCFQKVDFVLCGTKFRLASLIYWEDGDIWDIFNKAIDTEYGGTI